MRAAREEAILRVALRFIGQLTGMTPPPIEVAPPHVLKPFTAFVADIEKAIAEHTPAIPEQLPHPQFIKALVKERDGWREQALGEGNARRIANEQLTLMLAHQDRNIWVWQGDGEDHPESMGADMAVLIRADKLRNMALTKPEREQWAHAIITEAIRALEVHNVDPTHRSRETLRAELRELIAPEPGAPTS